MRLLEESPLPLRPESDEPTILLIVLFQEKARVTEDFARSQMEAAKKLQVSDVA